MFAVVSDIHGNIEALQEVFADIDRRSIKHVYCLGDIVGYGASPLECLDMIIERCEIVLGGNHDQAVFYEPTNFNVGAERASYWTRQLLEDETNKAARNHRWEVLGRIPVVYETKGLMLAHASPRRPIN
ncbi:MAG: metallophosphoesterase, partial [Planctomycetes bacterium]|nr:metallophosphoesterase [Planctomycetota bacterium]